MTTYKDLSIFLSGAVLLVSSYSGTQAADFSYALTPATIQPGERAVLEMRVPILLYENFTKEYPAVISDESFSKQNVLRKDEFTKDAFRVWRYEFTSYRPGDTVVPPIELQIGPHTFSTERTVFQVTTTRTDEDRELREGFGAVPLPRPIVRWLSIALLAAGAIGGFWIAGRHLLRTKPPPPVSVVTAPQETDLEWLRRQFFRLRQKMEHEKDGPFVDDLTYILKTYFAKHAHVPVESWTTREFRLQNIAQDRTGIFSSILDRCDQYKFQMRKKPSPNVLALECLQESEHALWS